ncbi:MAG: hypothetical protein ACLGIN_02160 [Candidatus Sericytochromatia bacterium]
MRDLSGKLADYVDEFADAIAASGMPILGGRALGYLLVCDPACQTAAEVARALGESQRETARMLQSLEASGMLECVALPDQEAPCYSVRPADQMLKGPIKRARAMQAVGERGLDVAACDEARGRLSEMADFYGFMARDLDELVDRWRASRKKSRASHS